MMWLHGHTELLSENNRREEESIHNNTWEEKTRFTGAISFFEGNGGSQDEVCTLFWPPYGTWDFQHEQHCQNDEARSAILISADPYTTITIYDSPSGSKSDDYTIIKIKNAVESEILIDSFEKSQEITSGGNWVVIEHHHHNGLDGKVSRVEIDGF